MNPHPGAQTRPERALFLGAFVIIALILGANVATIANLRQNALQSAESYLTGYSDVASEHAESSFRAVDVVLSSLADHIARDGVNDAESFAALSSDAAMRNQLTERLAGLPQVAAFLLVGAKGQIVASSYEASTAGINLADRDYFRALRDDPSVEIFVSAPTQSRVTGEEHIRIARRLSDPNGAFMGLMVGSLRKQFFESYYDAIISGEDTQVSLRRSDGLQLATHPKGAAPTMSASQSRRGSAGRRMISARRIANFPLEAEVSRSEASVLRDWTKTAWLLSLVSTLSALLVATVSLIMARRWRAQAAFLARLAESEAFARQKSMQFETTLANLPQGLCMFDRDMRIVVANTQYYRLYDLAPEDAPVGTTMAEVIERRIARGVFVEGDPDEYRRDELALRDESGGALRRLTNGRIIAINRFDMPGGGWISQHEDVTEAHGAMERISFLARHDSLTHLFNRAQLIEKMAELLDGLRRGDATGFCVFLLDLDMFKGVNDTLGHGVGDRLLRQVGQRLRRATRDVDVVARLGGDEFAILFILDAAGKREDAEGLATRLLAAIGDPYGIDAHQVVIGTSIGIATAPEDGLDVDDLMLKADLALYKAKAAGRNSFRFYDAMLENEERLRNNLQLDLHAALAGEQFELLYQPIVCAATQRVICAEALIRWRHPRDGLISPDSFIPIAEATGMIVPIGAWVIRRAALDALDWPDHVSVAVNISPVQFRKGDLVETIAGVLAETGFPARRLDVEITENVFMKDSSENLAIIRRLKQLGLSISLDDFGTGYSSLAYVRAFPLDKIKIDKSFVAEALQSSDCAAIVATIVHLARSLGITTVAEGVETQDQQLFLRAAGCTYFQGYYFGRPMSVHDMRIRLAAEGLDMMGT